MWLISRCKGGHMKIRQSNRQKLENLYVHYESRMYSVAYSILGNVEQAEDAVQDSFVKLSDYLDRIQEVEHYKTQALVLKIVKTTAINRYRKNQTEAGLFEPAQEQEIQDENNVIEQELMKMHNSQRIQEAAKDMPDIYREIIQLKFYYELTTREISKMTGLDEAAVRKRFERAKKYLRDRITGIGGKSDEAEKQQCAAQCK